MKHLIAVIVIIAIYAGSLLYKDQLLIEEKKIVPLTLNQERKENGTPVNVIDVKVGTLNSYHLISGFLDSNGYLRTEVAREIARSLKQGTKAEVEYKGKNYIGKITNLATRLNPLTGLLPITIKLENIPLEMAEKLTVVKVPNKTIKRTIILPRDAVSFRKKTPEVYTVDKNNRVAIKPVKIGISNSKDVSILNGIGKDEKVIISDQRDLNQNEKVLIVQ